MDDIEDDKTRYPHHPYGVSHRQGYGYMSHQKLPVRTISPYSQLVASEYGEDDKYEEEEEEEEHLGEEYDDDDDDADQSNNILLSQKDADDNEYGEHNNNEDEEEEEHLGEEDDDGVDQSNNILLSQKDADDNDDEEDGTNGDGDENFDNNDNDDDDDDDKQKSHNMEIEDNNDNGDDDDDNDDKQKSHNMEIEDDLEYHPKKRKLKSLISTYEFAPRVPAPSAEPPLAPKPSIGGRNPLSDWSEQETFVLLDVWGDLFLQHGRKSFRSEEWQEVAEKVSEVSKIKRTNTQCRNRLDTLKKKYKKEKIKFPEMGGGTSNWVYFKRMDKLMSSPPQQAGLSSGLDSGEYVSVRSRVYSNHANGLDEMDSPENTESTDEEGSHGPHAKKRRKGRGNAEASSFRLLAGSIDKFSKIYEKTENRKTQQMVELEKMRMDFLKDLETQRRQILERLQSEISKLEQTDDENDDSAENGT